MSFFNSNSFDPHDVRLYDLPENIEDKVPEPPITEELPEALIEDATSIPPVNPVAPSTQQPKQNPFQARMDAFTQRYNGDNTLNTQQTEAQEAATLREDLLKVDNLLKGLLNNPALNKASDQFTDKHIVAIKKYIQGTIYYCDLLNNDLVKPKIPPYA